MMDSGRQVRLHNSYPSPVRIRQTIARLSASAQSAHFGSSLSCVEILNAILTVSNIAPDTVNAADRDRLIMSKGHAAMAYYAVMSAHDLIPPKELENYLKDNTILWGHVTRATEIPVIDASTGSLGHGLSLAVGYAQAYLLRRLAGRIYCVLSDGELDEGCTWEAILFAGARNFENLTAVIDYNKIQSLDRIDNVLSLSPLIDKWRSFRWDAIEVDGHDMRELIGTLGRSHPERPLVIIAHTIKGKGVPSIENTVSSHYKPATPEDLQFLRNSDA